MQSNNIFINWLHQRKISDAIIKDFGIKVGNHFNLGECIVIPIKNESGDFSFNKYRRNPLDANTPKYMYDKGGTKTLYGAFKIKGEKKVLITEGEMDTLVAWSANIPAVSGTGGAGTFVEEWVELLRDKEVVICFDNDEAGGNGMAKVLEMIPWAKILFLPDRPGIKDISDYVTNGGDLRTLLDTAIRLSSLEEIIQDRSERISLWKSTFFHDAFIKTHTKPVPEKKEYRDRSKIDDKLLRAKLYPIDTLITFSKDKKAPCIFHSERTGSMHFYPENNRVHCYGCGKGGDPIDVYRQLHGCSFMEAVKALQ
jgi:DNA primase